MASSITLPEAFGKYRIVRQLGHGGMGSVWLAQDTVLERHIALKVPHLSDGTIPNEEILLRLRREAKAAASLDHPNICPVYEVGEIEGISYIAMAYLSGNPLAQLVGPDRPFEPRRAASLVRCLSLAVHEAHSLGVVHRDLKSANIIMNHRGDPVITDFGLAKRVNQASLLTQPGVALGTPEFMPPEQVEGRPSDIGPCSDIYSLGVILYELLCGRPPFMDQNTYTILFQIVNKPPPPFSQFRSGIDPDLEAICFKALAKKPADRHATAEELASELEKFLCRLPTTLHLSRETPPAAPPALPVPSVVVANDLSVVCPSCERRLKVPSQALGKRARCTNCKASFLVPESLSSISPAHPINPAPQAANRRDLPNALGMRFARIPAGSFVMGSPAEEAGRTPDEGPQHMVEITSGFHIAVVPVTQELYESVVGFNPSSFSQRGENREHVRGLDTRKLPVEWVSWEEAARFCVMLGERPEEKRAGRRYRLPTEAEWEYCARTLGASPWAFTYGPSLSVQHANFSSETPKQIAQVGSARRRPMPVGAFASNDLGIFDLHGNVWEWCHDWYHGNYYGAAPERDPRGPEGGTLRVARGGSWSNTARQCRSAARLGLLPTSCYQNVGFRVVLIGNPG